MVKKILLIVLFSFFLNGNFKKSCLDCHTKIGVNLRKTFMNALLVYGGEKNFKVALFFYCKNPTKMTSVMSDDFLKNYLPLKKFIKIDDNELKKSLNEYWNSYKVIGNLK